MPPHLPLWLCLSFKKKLLVASKERPLCESLCLAACKNKDFEAAIMEHLVRAANLGLSLFSVLETKIKSYVSMRKIYSLTVSGNEKQWGSGRRQMLGNCPGLWRSRFIYNLNTQLLNRNHIFVSALSSKRNKRLLRH